MKVLRLSSLGALFLCAAIPVNAANTIQDFSADFPDTGGGNGDPFIAQGNGFIEIVDAWDGNALRLTEEAASLSNGASFAEVVTGTYDSIQFDFDFQFSPNDPGSGADGIGFVYGASSSVGQDNVLPIPGFSEEANVIDSFGVGFDIWDNGGEGENSVSLHWDGGLVESRDVDFDVDDPTYFETGTPFHATIVVDSMVGASNVTVAVTDTDTGDTTVVFENEPIAGFTPYDGRMMFARTGGANSFQELDNIMVTHTVGGTETVFLEDFSGFEEGEIEPPGGGDTDLPPLVGGTPFTEFTNGSPPVSIINDGDGIGPQPGHMRLTEQSGGLLNSIAFDQTSDVADNITAEFKFKITGGNPADGMSFLILDSDVHGSDGELPAGFSEDPRLEGALGVGFDSYDNDEEGDDFLVEPVDEEGCGGIGSCADRRANHISLTWDGLDVGLQQRLDLDDLDLVNGEWNDFILTATEVEGGMNVSIVVVDGTDDSVHPIYVDEFVEGASFPSGARAAFGARTGGANSLQEVDDVVICWTGECITSLDGDYNIDGVVDVLDIDMQSVAMKDPNPDLATFDEDDNGVVDFEDRKIWVEQHKNTYLGDANLDGEFNSGDLVAVFTAGKYETGDMAGWAEGDWDGDMLFGSGDIVAAFQGGGFEIGPRPAAAAVPEPTSFVLVLLGSLMLLRRRNK